MWKRINNYDVPIKYVIRILERCIGDENTKCWIWTGAVSGRDRNHGHINVNGKFLKVHIVVYEFIIGPVPKDLVLDHIVCDNGLCVMPYHMKPVTNKMNILRGTCPSAINVRKDRCIYGHLLTEDNVYIRPKGRECRTCLKIRNMCRYCSYEDKLEILLRG